MRKAPQLPEQLAVPFDAALLEGFESRAVLESSIAELAAQGIVYGVSNASDTLQGTDHLTLVQRHQEFYQDLFSLSLQLAFGLEDRIDPAKYAGQVLIPIIEDRLSASASGIADIGNKVKMPKASKNNQKFTSLSRSMAELSEGVRAGVRALIENVPDAVARTKTVMAQADTVVPALKAEISGDPEKQFTILKLLTSDIGSREGMGFEDQGLSLATFLGIGDYDVQAGHTRIVQEFTSLLHDGHFDALIAREMIGNALEKAADSDPLTDEEADLQRMIDYVKFYSGDDDEEIIEAFITPEGQQLWPARCHYLLINKREWFVRSLNANDKRIQALIYDNYLGTIPLSKEEFEAAVESVINDNSRVTDISGMDIDRANALRVRAEVAQRERRKRLLHKMVGSEAVRSAQVERPKTQRPLVYLYPNGNNDYHVADNDTSLLSNYLDIYNGDRVLAEDLHNAIDYLREMSPEEMSRLLAQGNGLRTMTGHSIRINGKNHTICRMKPKRIPGLATHSPETNSMRIMFVQMKTGELGILEVVRRDRLERFADKH